MKRRELTQEEKDRMTTKMKHAIDVLKKKRKRVIHNAEDLRYILEIDIIEHREILEDDSLEGDRDLVRDTLAKLSEIEYVATVALVPVDYLDLVTELVIDHIMKVDETDIFGMRHLTDAFGSDPITWYKWQKDVNDRCNRLLIELSK